MMYAPIVVSISEFSKRTIVYALSVKLNGRLTAMGKKPGPALPIMKCSECGVPVFGTASLATGLPPVCPKCFNELRHRKPRPEEVEKLDDDDERQAQLAEARRIRGMHP
jgi:hypothetical protein